MQATKRSIGPDDQESSELMIDAGVIGVRSADSAPRTAYRIHGA